MFNSIMYASVYYLNPKTQLGSQSWSWALSQSVNWDV